MKELVRAVTLLGLEELVSELGGNLGSYADEIGFDLSCLQHPDRFVSSRQAHELANLAAIRLRRKDLGLLWGARSDPSRLGPLYVALMNALTGRESVDLIARYLHIHFPAGRVFLSDVPDSDKEIVGVQSLLHRPPPLVQFYERRVGSLHVILKVALGPRYRPEEVWFTHAQNAPLHAYQRLFGVRPLFEMPENGIVVSRRMLDADRPSANAQVREMALAYLQDQATPSGSSMVVQTRQMVRILMRSSNCTASEAARALGLHVRTLQRKLHTEGANFDAIKDEVRHATAEAMLADPDIRLVDIALALHYANMSAFTRSCTRWFGHPPTSVRREILGGKRRGARSGFRRARIRT